MSNKEDSKGKSIMIAIGGMSGVGKSSLADLLAKNLGRDMGSAVFIDSDETRKEMHGVAPHIPLPESAYTPQQNEAFVQYLRKKQAEALKTHKFVVVTGTFLDDKSRLSQRECAEKAGAEFIGLYLKAPITTLFLRITGRRLGKSASDADQRVLLRQMINHAGRQFHLSGADWKQINARRAPAEVMQDAANYIYGEIAKIEQQQEKTATAQTKKQKGPDLS